jgi:DNA-binding IclR family transcriptional regulator
MYQASDHPLSLGDASEILGVHKSTALRILQTLEARRFVRRTTAGQYVLGGGLIELAQRALGSLDLRKYAAGPLRRIQQQTGHTVHLAQLMDDEVIYVDKLDSPSLDTIQIQSRIGRPVSLYASGVGKTIVAFRSPEERSRLLYNVDLVQHTATTLATREALETEFAAIRERGWGTDDGELFEFVNCLAVPVRHSGGDVIAALSVTTVKRITPLSALQEHLPLLLEAARDLSVELGYEAPVGA